MEFCSLLPRDAMLVRYAMAMSVRLFCPSQIAVPAKRLNLSSRKESLDLVFWYERSRWNFIEVTLSGTPNTQGKICDFRQIPCYIAKTVQNRHIVFFMKGEQKVVCTLSNGNIADDL